MNTQLSKEILNSLEWIVSFCEEHPDWFGEGEPADGAEYEWLDEAKKLIKEAHKKRASSRRR